MAGTGINSLPALLRINTGLRTSGGLFIAACWMVVMFTRCSFVAAYECRGRCSHRNNGTVVMRNLADDACLIRLPDNPPVLHDVIVPCKLLVRSNCSSFCHVIVKFAKFNLPSCRTNLTGTSSPSCTAINDCEYVIIREAGRDISGHPVSHMVHVHGHQTGLQYQSYSDSVLIEFCYHAFTFSSRNVHVEISIKDPFLGPSVDLGPPSVYILAGMVVLMVVAIIIIRWCKCLDPILGKPLERMDSQ